MMHTHASYKTKKSFKADTLGCDADAYLLETSLYGPELTLNCTVSVAGPNEMHKWYAQVKVEDGVIVSVK